MWFLPDTHHMISPIRSHQGGEPSWGRHHHHGHLFGGRHGRFEGLPRRRLAGSGGICTTLQVGDAVGFRRPGVWSRLSKEVRSQTFDNMQRWKRRGGKSQRGEVKKWEDQSRERVGSKKMQVREKVGTSRFTVFFQCEWGASWPDERWKIARRCGSKHISKSKR